MKVKKVGIKNFKSHHDLVIDLGGGHAQLKSCNGGGKSTVLEAINVAAHGQKTYVPANPVNSDEEDLGLDKHGEPVQKKAEIEVEFDEYSVQAKITKDRDLTIVLRDNVGKKIPSKNATGIIRDFMGKLSLDGSEFASLGQKEQIAELLQGSDFDFEAKSEERDKVFAKRQHVGREFRMKKGALDEAQRHAGVKKVDISELLSRRKEIEESNREAERHNGGLLDLNRKLDLHISDKERVLKAIEALNVELNVLDDKFETLENDISNFQTMPVQSTDAIDKEIAGSQSANDKVADNERYDKLERECDDVEADYGLLSEKLHKIDNELAMAAQSYKIEDVGLSIENDGLMIHGQPWKSASTGQKMLASSAVQIRKYDRAGVKLRLLYLPEAALLDMKSRQVIMDYADKYDFQVIFEITNDNPNLEVKIIERGVH